METAPAQPNRILAALTGLGPGIAACLAIALVATWLGNLMPLVGAPVFAILIGILIGNIRRPGPRLKGGIVYSGKKILQLSIVLLGAGLSLGQVWQTGRESLGVMLISLAAALLAAWFIGRALNIHGRLIGLVGVGTGICGGSAIAAVAPIIEADDEEIAFAISTVFLFNVVAVFIFPVIGHALALTPSGFGLWAGTAINDTSSVVAAAYSYGKEAGDYATVTKLARTVMIVPICFGLALYMRSRRAAGRYSFVRGLPWFILVFLLAALLNSLGLFGAEGGHHIAAIGKFLIAVALAGVGLGASFAAMVRTGPKPILLGLLVWVCVALTSLLTQRALSLW